MLGLYASDYKKNVTAVRKYADPHDAYPMLRPFLLKSMTSKSCLQHSVSPFKQSICLGMIWCCVNMHYTQYFQKFFKHCTFRLASLIRYYVLTQELKKCNNSKSNVFMTSYDATNIIIFNVCQKIYEFLNSAAFRSNGSQSSRRLHCSNMCVNYSDHIL